ncbi:LysR substrate-binding domain-containing protein [Pseudovibrio brasiliensis]|uniref:LysR family transcriptional regulator n=1 Tax=Pseudovibrio brasiliensis TaxID=1898042 RepID=A0ABX8AU79_9HYPH|nr:LysR substrate-binding domain-containing protein [Pseudovibrio brasiliensis]QUS56786.1 LysR family transcriptional regulator [Pseudovibrio brasiliensis]
MPYSIDVDQLRTFLAVAELGSFTKAGDAVHKTQSAVSMQMKKLEERIGQPIFVKDGRNSRITEHGRRLVEHARRMVALNDETLSAFHEPEIAGRIRLGLPDDYAERLLPQVLAAFNRLNPCINLDVECSSSNEIGRRIQKGELDVGIVTSGDCTSVPGQIVRREPLQWVGSREHIVYDQRPLRLAVGPTTCSWRQAGVAALDHLNIQHQVVYTSASAAALAGAVNAGLAIAILPASALRQGQRILGEKEGLPPLPPCDITIIRSQMAIEPVHDALCHHIVASIGNVTMEYNGMDAEAAE